MKKLCLKILVQSCLWEQSGLVSIKFHCTLVNCFKLLITIDALNGRENPQNEMNEMNAKKNMSPKYLKKPILTKNLSLKFK